MPNRPIYLSDEAEQYAEALVESGEYDNFSAAVRGADLNNIPEDEPIHGDSDGENAEATEGGAA